MHLAMAEKKKTASEENTDVNNAIFKMFKKSALQMINEKGIAFNTFVRAQ